MLRDRYFRCPRSFTATTLAVIGDIIVLRRNFEYRTVDISNVVEIDKDEIRRAVPFFYISRNQSIISSLNFKPIPEGEWKIHLCSSQP